jgi:hypothetical protein
MRITPSATWSLVKEALIPFDVTGTTLATHVVAFRRHRLRELPVAIATK